MKLFAIRKPVAEQRRLVFSPGHQMFARGDNLFERSAVSAVRLSVVYGCVSLIAGKISCLPVDIVNLRTGMRVREGQPRARWVDKPDGMMRLGLTRADLLTGIVSSLLLDGTAFVAVGRDSAGRVNELVALAPSTCELQRRRNELVLTVNGQQPDYEVCIIRNVVLPGSLRGLSPIEAARATLDVAFGVQEQSARFFDQGAVLAGVITTNERIAADDAAELARAWQRMHSSTENSHLPLILQSAKYEPISVSPEQAQFLETRKFSDAQIAAQLFHVDPTLLGLDIAGTSLTYGNVGQRNRQLLEDALLPVMTRIEHCMSGLLPPGQAWRFDTSEFLRSDPGTRFGTYVSAASVSSSMGAPLMTVDKMREREGLPELTEEQKAEFSPPPPPTVGDVGEEEDVEEDEDE